MAEALNEALREEMERDEAVFVIGEDIGAHGGLFARHRRAARPLRRGSG